MKILLAMILAPLVVAFLAGFALACLFPPVWWCVRDAWGGLLEAAQKRGEGKAWGRRLTFKVGGTPDVGLRVTNLETGTFWSESTDTWRKH